MTEPPAGTVRGLTERLGWTSESVRAVEVPPAGGGETTVMESPLAVVKRSEAGTVAVSVVSFTYVVGRMTPLTCMRDARAKSRPWRVSVRSGLQAVAVDGVIESSIGTGYSMPSALPTSIRGLVRPVP